jgi:uncharacterized protein YPO0396
VPGKLVQQARDALQIVLDAMMHFTHQRVALGIFMDQTLLLLQQLVSDVGEVADVMCDLIHLIPDRRDGDPCRVILAVFTP